MRPPIIEYQPAIERSRSALTALTGLYPKIRSCPLDHVSQADLRVGNKSGQAYSVRWVLALLSPGITATLATFFHAARAIAFSVKRIW
jgi:hypothetical protein